MRRQVIVNSFAGVGPFCILFDRDHTTILDLKQQLTARTRIPTTIQSIKSSCGRSLSDNDPLFISNEAGPVIYNVKIVTATLPHCSQCANDSPTGLCHCSPAHSVKKAKTDEVSPPIATLTLNATMWFPHLLSPKGKAKETKKRKFTD